MDDRLRVDDDPKRFQPDGEQVERLDKLQALVEHRRAVDADFCAHVPVRMLDRLRRSGGCQLFMGPVAKWSAAGGERDAAHMRSVVPGEALEDRIVLAVDGQQRGTAARDSGGHHIASRNQRLLVGQPDDAALLDYGHRRRKTGAADDGGNHQIGGP